MLSRAVRLLVIAMIALALPFAMTACGGSGKKITIGTKFDQPGLAVKKPDGTMAGFDVDVATYVAGQLGYKPDEIEWKEAPSGQRETLIQNGQVDFIAASYSITDARKQKVDFAGPYLITGQSLLVRADNNDITGADSLQNGKRLCSVSGSTPAQRIKDKYPGVQLQQYDTYSACVEALRNGAIDAVSTDEVILAGFAAQFPGAFKIIGKPFSKEPYGIGLRKGDSQLRTKINDAIVKMEKDGDWKAAFDKNLGPAGITAPPPPPLDTGGTAGQAQHVDILGKYKSQIIRAFWTTIQLTFFAAIGALILGTFLAAMRLSPVPMLRTLGTAYVNVVRNTPLTLIILFCSFGLAQTLGVTLADPKSPTSIADSNFRLAALGLTLYTASFVCETVRSGVNTIPLGQAEAARSLGLTFGQNLRIILLPQAFRAVIIPLGSVLIALVKNTTIASAIGVAEAALLMKEMIENTAALLVVGTIFAIGFVILTLPLGLLFGWLGKRLAVAR
ncbi:ABC transporter substrate-binding protein [Mycolicibacterium aromaticivorans JS19b1 = JCM 16368]|uniref:ABC transporter substrate-binding protein n=1 Tax=Mycolicibacterium aromaticivorans JS19b1 = JCM 16368 TaxID=1440774 RepID=A0A064CC06_9MYCO|nr:ABC transporter substrate-binding protein [Mycolicibacterium aromaticivorans JS19b1 = JCM 16368]